MVFTLLGSIIPKPEIHFKSLSEIICLNDNTHITPSHLMRKGEGYLQLHFNKKGFIVK